MTFILLDGWGRRWLVRIGDYGRAGGSSDIMSAVPGMLVEVK